MAPASAVDRWCSRLHLQPLQAYFEALFGDLVDHNEMNTVYYPIVRQILNLSPMPAESIFNRDVGRAEIAGKANASATVGLSNHGNRDGAQFDLTFENWYVPGLAGLNLGVVATLGIAFDQANLGTFVYDASSGGVELTSFPNGNAAADAVTKRLNDKIAAASGRTPGVEPFFPAISAQNWTAHPLGGAVIGQATDAYGRVAVYTGHYVMDGALIPGSTRAVNPSLAISALAERNIAKSF